MIDPHDFSQQQSELTTEFAKYILDHPEADDSLPEESYIYFFHYCPVKLFSGSSK